MQTMIRKSGGRVLRALMACMLVLSALGSVVLPSVFNRAYASESSELEVGGSIYYAGYSTNWMLADGSMAYCGNPSAATPGSGSYQKGGIDAPSGRSDETIADLWFGYGSPGFDAGMFPDTWYDGSEMTDARYAALTHIIVSDTFSSNGDYALYGCSQDFKDWARYNVIGFGEDGSEINENATGRQMCRRAGEGPSNFSAFELFTGAGTQIVLSFKYIPNGSVELTKLSANPSVSDGNACYSTQGAVYGIYSDAACTSEVARMTTDAAGYARADEIAVGDYYVKEISASTGMWTDDTAYPVTVRSNKVSAVNGGTVYDIPFSDPVGMLVGKVDATTNANRPQSAASLKGAEFTVEYFDGDYASVAAARASGQAHDTWVFVSDEDGFAYYADEFKVSGPDLYRQTNGTTACLPIGTVLITETKAPVGYNLDDGDHNDPKTFLVRITDEGAVGENVYTYNSPVSADTVERGDYRLVKEVSTNNDEEDQELTRIAIEGIQFQIINDNDGAVVSPDSGELVEKGGVVCTITTDEDGFATTKDHHPQGWTGALAYGDYTVHEVIPDDVAQRVKTEYGITLIGVDDWAITVSTEGQYKPVQIVVNHIPQTPIVIQKVDSTTGKAIPLPCSFQLFDADGELVTYNDRYAGEVVDTWTTLSSGKCTLPMKLDEGTYRLHEVESPEGYVLGGEDIKFTVDEYRTWDDPITVTYADAPIRAEIQILKTDGESELPVEGAEYCIKAEGNVVTGDGTIRFEDGQIVGYVTTDAEGKASVEDLYLGNYVIYETKSPEDWALDTSEHHVSIESQGQLVPIVVESFDAVDAPTTIELLKVDGTDADKKLAGATFHIWQVSDDAVVDGIDQGFSVLYETDVITGSDGTADVSYLPHGSYLIEETEAPEGYYTPEDSEPIAFEVNDQGFIGLATEGSQFASTLALTFENTPTLFDVTKTDLTSGAELPGATLAITDEDGVLVEEWVSTEEAHRVIGIAPGSYTLTETIAPEGYLLTTSVPFEVKETGEVQSVVMKDDYTKIDISKTDIATGEELPGAHLAILDKDGKTVAEWDTTDEVHRINGLESGDYTLRETSAPDGYEVAEDVAFTVEETGDVQKVEMKDKSMPDSGESLPKTGDDLPPLPIVALFGALGCAAATVALAKHRGHKEKDEDEGEGGGEE
ncbi:SpaA isopeptide-forming pilin-related protein [Paraeggerthella hongkongensis]|uniref:Collagen-binding protein n=1 Tax=Paraeggerthella hongkongensis TaxID=230658 RepID=A0A3N0BF45_9ACTN|nr:SpaA isopeptide-forming pilin-related protein [Paraeggerthella hongkongensis]RNL46016.1 hypothetical protein DMP08_04725 [Paraeggerthella hongkongensis]